MQHQLDQLPVADFAYALPTSNSIEKSASLECGELMSQSHCGSCWRICTRSLHHGRRDGRCMGGWGFVLACCICPTISTQRFEPTTARAAYRKFGFTSFRLLRLRHEKKSCRCRNSDAGKDVRTARDNDQLPIARWNRHLELDRQRTLQQQRPQVTRPSNGSMNEEDCAKTTVGRHHQLHRRERGTMATHLHSTPSPKPR